MSVDPRRYALDACAEYEHWASEVGRLTNDIRDCICPKENVEDPTGEFGSPFGTEPSCFQRAKNDPANVTGSVESGPAQPNLFAIAKLVAGCPSCSKLCDLISARRHARNRFGIAKRKVRHAGKLAEPTP